MPKTATRDGATGVQEPAPAAVPHHSTSDYRPTVAERRALGVAARQHAHRADHGTWSPAPDRRNPIMLLQSQDRTRVQELVPIRYGRMLASPFAFLRGSAIVMAHDLARTLTSGIVIQLCSDSPLADFGLFGSPERELLFDVNDFDETLPVPWGWDVKRLAASVVVAAREPGFSAATARERRGTVPRRSPLARKLPYRKLHQPETRYGGGWRRCGSNRA